MVESIKELRKVCQPDTGAREFIYIRCMRRLSIYFTKLFLIIGLSANQASLIQFVLMGGSLLLLLGYGNVYLLALSAVVLNVSYLFDHVDGEIARYRGSTYFGRMLDIIGHDLFYSVFAIVGFAVFLETGQAVFMALGSAATFFTLAFRLHMVRFELLNAEAKVKGHANRYARYFYDVTLANFFLPILYVLAFLGLLPFFLYFYGIYMPVFWAGWLVRKRKPFRKKQSGKSDEKLFWDEMRENL